ncbi:MAG: excinuclease ABC subunit UvrA [Acidobacteriota bacterium]|nr:MAG: excinuclease ABC subunit UvrA [Acidobacteriota bacterium]
MAIEDVKGDPIEILGATQNNLKNIDVTIPANSMTIVTGLSGSGKSSLAFDTLYAEGQRRYVESMSAYARQFLERLQKPAVREIRGISPAIAIRQKNASRNPRSTVGTVTEIYDFLRLLYARAGSVICRGCGQEVRKDTADQAVDDLLSRYEGARAYITFPLTGSALDLTDEEHGSAGLDQMIENLLKQGFYRLIDGLSRKPELKQLPGDRPETLDQLMDFNILVDRLVLNRESRDRLTDSIELSFAEGNGVVEVTILLTDRVETLRFSERFECQSCELQYRAPEPRLFSFNNPYGACPTCHGFGSTITLDRDLIIPDSSKTLLESPIDPFSKPKYQRFQRRLLEFAANKAIPTDVPYEDLPQRFQDAVWQGVKGFPGVKGFFAHLAKKKYKMHVRIFIARYRGYARCFDCNGERLRPEAMDVYISGKRIAQLTQMPISEAHRFFDSLQLPPARMKVAGRLLLDIQKRLSFLVEVGLDYLSLDRITSTLSGGEMQRIHLAASLGSSLAGTLYVLDEPSIGLHPRDQDRLVDILRKLRDLGNTIVVVEHERDIIQSGDHIIDIGPGAGEHGGEIVFSGTLDEMIQSPESLTGKYLRGEAKISIPVFRRSPPTTSIEIFGARQHNLKNLDVRIPLGGLVCISGVSGSGKSTLVHDILYAGSKKLEGDWKGPVGKFDRIEGLSQISDIILVDQTPIGRTPRSNPITYVKAFDDIRKLFASLREAHSRNLSPAHFSFNLPGGRCEVCQGSGTITVEMQFLADVELLCEECKGTRFQKKVLEVTTRGKNIHDILNMTVQEAIAFFSSQPSLVRKLKVLRDVGLGYLRLGQSATTLSGGEAQRIKLAAYLSRKTKGKPLFIFDEPTTGLHFDDISKLLKAFDRLIESGATVLVIEHNLDVIKCADWVIDLGPEGGEGGGTIVAEGTPEELTRCGESHTGKFLRNYLEAAESSVR